MVLMLLLMGKGFNITRGRLRQASAVRLTLFMCLYSITYTTLFIYEQLIFDPGEVLYLYESPAGYGLIVLRLLAWFMFCYNCFFTIKHYPEKSHYHQQPRDRQVGEGEGGERRRALHHPAGPRLLPVPDAPQRRQQELPLPRADLPDHRP
ncbi:hypothetical protein C7M84_013196 [Penaeus vannamei]|uniref:GPR180/TMEM145 transmembrane domain-containing protein n=1 Tax=Penaeus vannamei TaxID=6689 RepID=A0A423SX17_PENVA|nr:hypothetical protein C7M84_013196 [Penaeus vannamei]